MFATTFYRDANTTVEYSWDTKLIRTVPAACVGKIKGNLNRLDITVTETENNATGTYDVGSYKVYVETKGNTVRNVYIAE